MATVDHGSSAAAVRHHYDVSNDFYRLWLDPTMTYSGALYGDGDGLAAAQERKLDFHIESARARGAARVLDVGCGWGGLMRRMLARHGVERTVGLTLSEAQASFIRGLGDPRIEVRVERWADHQPAEPYDAIISIGAFEHFARFGLRVKDRIESYRSYFRRCHEMLKPGAWTSLQTIVKGNTPLDRELAHEMVWIYEEMFPEVEIPRFAEVVEATEKLFEVVTVRNDREHYARTLRDWRANLEVARGAATEVAGAEMVAKYDRYLDLSARQFERGTLGLGRFAMRRV
jgi:cyclopropane-fatty-acyl-phospholipid synthase